MMLAALVLGIFLSSVNAYYNRETFNQTSDWKYASSVYDFKVNTIEGREVSMRKYDGYVLLIVNVASKCGYTERNYDEMNQIDKKYFDQGLRVLAFPCNQFNKQEPGNAVEICNFVNKKNVRFDVFQKIKVNGEDAHPLWKYLKFKKGGLLNDDIKWNFTKFIIDRSGEPVERHISDESPLDLERNLLRYL